MVGRVLMRSGRKDPRLVRASRHRWAVRPVERMARARLLEELNLVEELNDGQMFRGSIRTLGLRIHTYTKG